MELTIEQALQQAVEAHKAGKFQDAEALYRAILQAQPKHPDANHNLGVLAVSLNKPELALPFLKTALEVNSNQVHFWISYVNALIKTNQLEIAKSVLEQGKKLGLAGERVVALEAQLRSILVVQKPESILQKQPSSFTQQRKKALAKKEKRKNSSSNQTSQNQVRSPSQVEVNRLLEHYQKGRYDLAESLANQITQKYPDHQFSWKVLGALFMQTGRLQDSLIANQRAVAISPNDAEAHSNLGNIMQDLGRLEDAEASYNKSIAIKPEYAEAHNNLGSILRELGRLEDAETSYNKAIAIKPEYAEAHSNLGSMLRELGRLEDAKASYNKAIAIKPDLAEAYSNLGVTLKELGRLEDAEASYNKAIAIKPDLAKAHSNLGYLLLELGRLAEAEARYAQAIRLKPDFIDARNEMLTCLYLMDKKSLFFDELDYLIKQDQASSVIGSLTCRAALRYGEDKLNIFCNNPLERVVLVDLKSRYNFEEIFVHNLNFILSENKRSNRKQNLLLNGYQSSGNLFLIGNNHIDEIQKIIRLEIERYRINFENSEEGFIRKWPTNYSLNGWLISMKSGGELQPHIHDKGWLSGSIYINVPPNSKNDSGKLVVALGKDSDATYLRQNSKKIIDVVTGSMALFPASLMHHTIPFESEEERIVLAFDVIPKS